MKITLKAFLLSIGRVEAEITTYTGAEALRRVKQNGYALQYVKDQTPDVCLEAVKQNGYALRYVKDQTPDVCLEAVKQNGYALRYVNPAAFEPEPELEQAQVEKKA